MPILSVLTEHEQNEFEHPPILSTEARSLCFTLPKAVKKQLYRLRTPTNKVGFLLQYVYFKVCKRFFVVSRFREVDIYYAAKMLNIKISKVNLSTYKKKIPADHQKLILKLLGSQPFDIHALELIEKELELRMNRLTEPRKIFMELLQRLYSQRIEVPTYHRLVDLISKHYLVYESRLLLLVKSGLKIKERNGLDALLTVEKGRNPGLFAQLKTINQSITPRAIQASVSLFQTVDAYFKDLLPLISQLKLTEHNSTYYATWVKKAKISQLKQFPEKDRMYLYLTAFFQNQFCLRQDNFIDIVLKCVQATKNTASSS